MNKYSSCFDHFTADTHRLCEVNVVLQTTPSVDRGSYRRMWRSAEQAIIDWEWGDQSAPRKAFWPTISFFRPHNYKQFVKINALARNRYIPLRPRVLSCGPLRRFRQCARRAKTPKLCSLCVLSKCSMAFAWRFVSALFAFSRPVLPRRRRTRAAPTRSLDSCPSPLLPIFRNLDSRTLRRYHVHGPATLYKVPDICKRKI